MSNAVQLSYKTGDQCIGCQGTGKLFQPMFAETSYAYRTCHLCGGSGVFVEKPYKGMGWAA